MELDWFQMESGSCTHTFPLPFSQRNRKREREENVSWEQCHCRWLDKLERYWKSTEVEFRSMVPFWICSLLNSVIKWTWNKNRLLNCAYGLLGLTGAPGNVCRSLFEIVTLGKCVIFQWESLSLIIFITGLIPQVR